MSPDGATVFVTGTSPGARDSADHSTVAMVTIAIDAASGSLLWQADVEDADNAAIRREARAMVITGDGATLVVTGRSYDVNSGSVTSFATVAYNASSGAGSWRVLERGDTDAPSGGARDIAIGPDDLRVFVVGSIVNAATAEDIGIASYAVSPSSVALIPAL